MTKGVRAYEGRTNKAIIHLFRKRKQTILDIMPILRCGKSKAYKIAENYRILTIGELLMLSGCLDIPFIELVAMLHLNTPKLNKEQREGLEDIIKRVEGE